MYSEGLMDLMEMMMMLPFIQDAKEKLENIENRAKTRYLPVFEKVCFGGENAQLQCPLGAAGKSPNLQTEGCIKLCHN